jgi:soluble lytic murein transglycosylase-like protein
MNTWSNIWLLMLLTGMLCGVDISVVRAEPYLRVHKDGVIYYYFSNREDQKARQMVNTRGIRLIRPKAITRPNLPEMEALIHEASRQHNLPPSLIKAVIRVESNFNPAATSPKGAQGLMQLMPATANHLQIANPYDIRENILGGTRYLGMLLQKFDYRLHLALAAYNAGPERVERCRDVPANKETQDFVRDVCTNFLKYSGEKPGGQ